MKRLTENSKLKRLGGGIGPRKFKVMKPLLHFAPDARENPMGRVKLNGKDTPDVKLKKEIDAVGLAFRAAAKSSQAKMAHEDEGYGAEYAVVVFQNAEQCTTFFEELGYPEPYDVFIDGQVLAQMLKVKLPDAPITQRKLKAIHNPKLTRLAKSL